MALCKTETNKSLKPQAERQRKSCEVLNKELQAKIEEAIDKGQVPTMPASPFRNIEEFTGLFDIVEGNRGIIKTPYQDVVVDIKYAFNRFTRNTCNENRERIKGGFFSTFQQPLFIVEKDKSIYFYKPFYDKKRNIMDLFGIGIDENGYVNFRTYYLDKRGNRIREMLNNEEIQIKYIRKWD